MTFEEFTAGRLPAVLRFATALTGDPHLAQDVVQEVLIRASRRWPEIGQLDRPDAYVRKMIVNEFLSWRRRSWRLVPADVADQLGGPAAPDPADRYADRQALLAELAKLTRRQRTALVLRYYEGYGDAEIAQVMGCSQSTVRGHVFKALAALRIELDQPLPAGVPAKGDTLMERYADMPARGEADLRDALAELADRAPATQAVLNALPQRGGRRWHLPRAAGRSGWPRLALGPPRHASGDADLDAERWFPGGVRGIKAPARPLSNGSLARAMLTAYTSSADQLMYLSTVTMQGGHETELYQTWSWPAVPRPGHEQRTRDTWSQIPRGSKGPLKMFEDSGYVTAVPPPSVYGQNAKGQITMVCYAGTGNNGCGWDRFDTPLGTWSRHSGLLPYGDYTPQPGGSELAHEIAEGEWRIIGHTSLHGQQTIKLAENPSGQYAERPVILWVSTASYLPLRMDWGPANLYQIWNWSYLPPTQANLAQLRVPIPPGYHRSS